MFVAHTVDVAGPREFSLDGTDVVLEATTYRQLVENLDAQSTEVLDSFERLFRRPLSEQRTPDTVRASLNSIIGQ